jgi:mono/diheme cytochrome c family protein
MNRNLFKKRTLWFTVFITLMIAGLPDLLLAKEALQCPQPRFTQQAPEEIYNLKNPLESTPENIKIGQMLYQNRSKPMPCKHCHGASGDGRGPMARGFDPPPRDFTCSETINGVPDGQLFWIIKNGSPGTGMLSFKGLKDEQVWQILLYVRQLAKE